MAKPKKEDAPKEPARQRNLALHPTSAADLDALAAVSASDQARIAARFRATTKREYAALLDAVEVPSE